MRGMQALVNAVVQFLRTNVSALDGRVHSGIVPEGEQLPAAVVDSTSQHDGQLGLDQGVERAGLTVRCMTEELASDDDAATDLAAVVGAVEDVLTGRDSSAPALVRVGAFDVLDIARASTVSYAKSEEGRRVLHSATEYDVTLERE